MAAYLRFHDYVTSPLGRLPTECDHLRPQTDYLHLVRNKLSHYLRLGIVGYNFIF